MEWLSDNWVLVLVVGGMAAMHLFGHGHGGHKHDKTAKRLDEPEMMPDASADTRAASEDA